MFELPDDREGRDIVGADDLNVLALSCAILDVLICSHRSTDNLSHRRFTTIRHFHEELRSFVAHVDVKSGYHWTNSSFCSVPVVVLLLLLGGVLERS